ncbi:Crp/Fnr family transcriptional regulator [Chryseobacterium sp.]|jgi:CRP/FNR family transcriptional regulator|uniref:Crp/Fnr family transcriptional regulator n=1 Tax=Chryseobacterium sp. TaxID=1871047 RepID=UPI0028504DE8|nr:Crp/Fnr family transcriptional regulator [Chryseobacterium sp.]MDR3025053.1 Crp/Fnr family transcriptional regulator [Chryseobacterium sp.]
MEQKNNIVNGFISRKFGFLGESFLEEIRTHGIHEKIEARQEIIREGDRVKYVLFLIKGAIKVYSLNDGRELVYYYIGDEENCLMTFSSIFNDNISKVYATTEEHSEVLLVPLAVMNRWLVAFPAINTIFFHEYEKRFSAVMDMINEAMFHHLDIRVINYIKRKVILAENQPVKIKHREIAGSLGTSREVVSRVLKKIENEGKIFKDEEGRIMAADQMLTSLNK